MFARKNRLVRWCTWVGLLTTSTKNEWCEKWAEEKEFFSQVRKKRERAGMEIDFWNFAESRLLFYSRATNKIALNWIRFSFHSHKRFSWSFKSKIYLASFCHWSYNYLAGSRCLKLAEKVSFNIASEASYFYISSGQKLIKNAKKLSFLTSFWKPEPCSQTVLPDRSVLIGQKLVENPKIQMRHLE